MKTVVKNITCTCRLLGKQIDQDQPDPESGPEVLKLYSCSTQLGMKVSLHAENQNFVCFQTLRHCINPANKCLKFQQLMHFSNCEDNHFHAHLS